MTDESVTERTLDDLRWILSGLEDINSGRRRNLGITRNCAVRLREVIERLDAERNSDPPEPDDPNRPRPFRRGGFLWTLVRHPRWIAYWLRKRPFVARWKVAYWKWRYNRRAS
jgi:hypothetical protein